MNRRNRILKTQKKFYCIRNAVIGAVVILLVGLFARGPLAADLLEVLQQLGVALANSWMAVYGGSDAVGKVFLMIAAAYFATVVVLLVKDRKERKQKVRTAKEGGLKDQKVQTAKEQQHTSVNVSPIGQKKEEKGVKSNPKSTTIPRVVDLEKKENRIS